MTDRYQLTESDVCQQFITPAIVRAGWRLDQAHREVSFTDGRIQVQKGLIYHQTRKRADYLLFYRPNLPLAVVEAKNFRLGLGDGLPQGLDYAECLDVPFVFSSNGSGFLFLDRTNNNAQQELSLDEFPSPEHLWQRYRAWKGLRTEAQAEVVTSPGPVTDKTPRYYQQLAINRTLEAIARGNKRCLLTMATGTGKTFVAFQIMWRLWKQGKAKRILFLADRNILVDQARINDFRPFKSTMTKLSRSSVDARGRVDTAYQVYLALYQAIMGAENREPIYDKFPRDFFDLIVIDECHRGSAREDSQWRTILEYFEPAIQIGLTATPKETKYVSNIEYFGPAVYTYSLKQGINDGFLAPFKVIRVQIDHDTGWRPNDGQADATGAPVEDREFNLRDVDRTVIFPERTKLVAQRITAFLNDGDPMRKTIVFCENIDHAERMREALCALPENAAQLAKDPRYVMRITGDATLGKAELDNFIDPAEPYPVIVTTSKLLSTGVDAQTCQLIVLDKRVESLTEFKQIIGRGTRLRVDYGKFFFTILDFKGATARFNDEDWDGPAIQVYEPRVDDPIAPVLPDLPRPPATEIETRLQDDEEPIHDRRSPIRKVTINGTDHRITSEWVQYIGPDGEMITETFLDFSRATLTRQYASLDDFLTAWNATRRKAKIIQALEARGLYLEELQKSLGKDYDPFDLICHLAFNQPPLTRAERVRGVRKTDPFSKYGPDARRVLEGLLEKFARFGVVRVESTRILKAAPFPELGTNLEIFELFGEKEDYQDAVAEMAAALYAVTPESLAS